jgi:hypothetical protein
MKPKNKIKLLEDELNQRRGANQKLKRQNSTGSFVSLASITNNLHIASGNIT